MESYFLPLMFARLMAAWLSPIPDCDEVYNFWEPLHYLMYGEGFEPWEYSPQYGLRSWSYILLHYLLLLPAGSLTKGATFYAGRMLLGTLSAAAETYFLASVQDALGGRVAKLALAFSLLSPGMFLAAPALLPTSFCLMCLTAAQGLWLSGDRRALKKMTVLVGLATVVGWPFAALVMAPVALDCVGRHSFRSCFAALGPLPIIIGVAWAVDCDVYGVAGLSTFRLLSYNVLGTQGGADSRVYGVEPWHYFAKNLALNFNVAFPLALAAPPLLLLRVWRGPCPPLPGKARATEAEAAKAEAEAAGAPATGEKPGLRQRKKATPDKPKAEKEAPREQAPEEAEAEVEEPDLCGPGWLTYTAPFFVWFVFWTLPAHKEERFMVPAYNALFLCAAIAADSVLRGLNAACGRRASGPLHPVARALQYLLIAACAVLSLGRIAAQTEFYGAPVQVYGALARHHAGAALAPEQGEAVRVCVGKEWHRFPSHFHLHPSMKAYFVRSGFTGLLPTHFDAKGNGTWTVHRELNNNNTAVWTLPSIVEVGACDYLVDLDLRDQAEPSYLADRATWEVVAQRRFLDAGRSPVWSRALYVPWVSDRHNTYAPYVALKRRRATREGDLTTLLKEVADVDGGSEAA